KALALGRANHERADVAREAARDYHGAHFAKLAFAGAEHAMEELRQAFNLGSDPATLDPTEARTVDEVMAQIDAARSGAPPRPCDSLSTLDVRGACRDDGGSALSLMKVEQAAFGHYGVLPAHRLTCLDAAKLEDLEHAVDRIIACG